MNGPHFETRSVTRVYAHGSPEPVTAVDGVTAQIPRGGLCVITGPSGCGKTTLLRLLAALDRPTSGEVLRDGHPLSTVSESELSRLRRSLGLVFQDTFLLPRVPVWENVAYGLIAAGVSRRERHRRAAAALERVGIAHLERKQPDALSGGERQRVGVARAIVGEPEAVMADEPTAHLDDEAASRVLEVLDELRNSGTTLIIATHRSALVEASAQVIRLAAGRSAVRSRD